MSVRSASSRSIRRIRTSRTSRRSATHSRGAERGVYRTKDGGKTWQKVLFINEQTGVVSLAINWSNPNEIYAGAWRAQRKPWTIISGGPAAEGGVYKTTDGGDQWTRLSDGFPDDLIGKVWVDIAQSNPKVVYAQVEAKGDEGGVYRSADSGATWTLVNSGPSISRPAVLLQQHVRQPEGRKRSLGHALSFQRSTDGGRTFTLSPTPHGDDHVVWINPDNPKILIETNDGGANITQDNGKSWSTQMNQPTAEFYMVDADEQFPYPALRPAAGQQHGLRRQRAAVLVAAGSGDADMVPGLGLRERPDPADAGRQDRLWRLQRRVRPLQRRDRAGTALLGVSAAALRQEPEGHEATASCGRRRSRSTPTIPRSSITARSMCTARSTAASTGRGSARTSRQTTPKAR